MNDVKNRIKETLNELKLEREQIFPLKAVFF